MVANAQAASASDKHTRHVVENAITKAIENDVDVIGWCEVGDVDVRTLVKLCSKFWDSKQFGVPNADLPISGIAVSWNTEEVDMSNFSITLGSKATSEGKWKTGSGIRDRSILSSSLFAWWRARLHVIHAPPGRAPIARAKYMAKAIRKVGIILGDANLMMKNIARLDPRRRVVSVGVLAIIVPRRFWVSKPTKIDIGSDHFAFFVDLEPTRVRRKRRADRRKT